MTFIVTLIALLIERFFDCSHLRRWGWYTNLQQMVLKNPLAKSPYAALALSVVPILLIVFILDYLLSGLLYGFIRLIFELAVLLYCFGPNNLWANAFLSLTSMAQGDTQSTEKWYATSQANYSQSQTMLGSIFIEANRRVFAVVFWYVILGPIGAVLYRTISLSAHRDSDSALAAAARMVESVLDWIPVRLLTFLFGLGGHFVQVINCWRRYAVMGLNTNEMLLTECGAAALGNEEQTTAQSSGTTERNALALLDRSFVILIVIIAVLALIA